MLTRQHRSYFVYLFLLLSTFSLFTAQCGSADESNQPEVAPVTLRWITWDPNNKVEETVVNQFRERYPQIEFKRERLNSPWEQTLNQTPPPDLLNIDAGYNLNALIRQGKVSDLTDFWHESGLLDQIPASLQSATAWDGKQYYVPLGFGRVGIYYNKQVFADHNLQPPQTWEEFILLCDTLLSVGETPIAISGDNAWVNYVWFEYLNLRLNGPAFHRGLMTGQEQFDDPRVRIVLETWKQLFDNGYFVKNPQRLGQLEAVGALLRSEPTQIFSVEKAVLVLTNTANISQLPTPLLDELDFFRFPIIDLTLPVAEAVELFGYVVPMGAEHLPQALTFLTHLSQPETLTLLAGEAASYGSMYAPARTDVDRQQLHLYQQQTLTLLSESDDAVPLMWSALPESFWQQIRLEFVRFIREPHDVERFIKALETARQKAVASGELTSR
jgi:ABC-type glycerol-3-phosphate transport system substrate-binding protein